MLRQFEFVSWPARGVARKASNAAFANAMARSWADKFEELVLRVRRAGLLFFGAVAALLLLALVGHPIGLLLWLIALPLAGFGSLLSMFWPTGRFARRPSKDRATAPVSDSTLAWLNERRREVPLSSRSAFELVIERVKRSQTLAGDGDDLLAKELHRLANQHLPRLVQSFLALPPGERTTAWSLELTEGLAAIAGELEELNERLLASRTQRFEIERRFVASRYPRRDGLAGL